MFHYNIIIELRRRKSCGRRRGWSGESGK